MQPPTYGKNGFFKRLESRATGDGLAVWFIPAAAPSALARGNLLLVHGVCSHSRFEWFSHPETAVYDELWAKQKARLIENDGVPINDEDPDFPNDPCIKPVYLCPLDAGGGVMRSPTRVTLRMDELPPHLQVTKYSHTVEGQFEGGWAERFVEAGWNVCFYDQHAHGISEGPVRCNVTTFSHLVSDCLQVWNELNAVFPGAKHRVICGLSMGGLLVARFLETGGAFLKSSSQSSSCSCWTEKPTHAILMAPALGLEAVSKKGCNPLLLPLASVLSKLSPNLKIVKRAHNTDYCYVEALAEADPLFYTESLPCRLSGEMLASSALSQAETNNVPSDVRVLLVHSRFDDMCDPAASVEWIRKIDHVKQRELWLLDDGWHFLNGEPHTKLLQQRILDFWLPSR